MDLLPTSLGLEGADDIMSVVLARDSMLPIERTRRFPTSVDNQTTCKISVRQGDN